MPKRSLVDLVTAFRDVGMSYSLVFLGRWVVIGDMSPLDAEIARRVLHASAN
jgi:hypothetical protein